MSRVGIIGAGSWGTALSLVLANNGHSVEIWSIVESEIEMLKEKHEHIDCLCNMSFRILCQSTDIQTLYILILNEVIKIIHVHRLEISFLLTREKRREK